MIEIVVRAEIQTLNIAEKNCVVILFGVALQNQQEVGRFFIDKNVIENAAFEKYVNLVSQTLDQDCIQLWENDSLITIKDSIRILLAESNKF